MKNFWNKLKENDYVITMSASKSALYFSAFMMFIDVLFYFVLTPKWVSGKSQYGPSPQMFPNLLTIAMFLCCLTIFVTELYKLRKKKKAEGAAKINDTAQNAEADQKDGDLFDQLVQAAKSDEVTIDLHGLVYILAVVSACLFYVFCAETLGFILTIAIIMVFLMLLYGVRSPLTIIIATVVMSAGVYFAFTKLLSLVLPAGTLF